MTPQARPRLEEFFLALLWIVGTFAWGYFGLIGYIENLSNNGRPNFSLTGFILSYFLLCLTVFGLRFAANVLLRIWQNRPGWVDTLSTITLGVTLFSGALFSLFTLSLAIIHLFTDRVSDLVFGWTISACVGIIILALIQLTLALKTTEPFLGLYNGEDQPARGPLSKLQRRLAGSTNHNRLEDQVKGPLILEADENSSLVEEKPGGRPGLEKTLVAHGGFHAATIGFTSNGTVVFAVSDGGMVHYQAGGRKGTMFPPELKFWEWGSSRVQTAMLGTAQTFLTRNYQTPPGLRNYCFLVPQSGGKFAWATPQRLQVGTWHNDDVITLDLPADEGLVLRGYGGFSPLAFSPEGDRLAWCASDGQTRIWHLETNQVQPLRAYPALSSEAHTGTEKGAWGLLFSPEGSRIATLGGRGILLQNVHTGWRWFRTMDPAMERLTAFAFNNNGLEMAVGLLARPEAIRLNLNGRRNRNGNGGPVAPDGEFVPVVRLWDLREDRYFDVQAGASPLREVCYSPDNRSLTVVDEAGMLWLWDIMAESPARQLPRLVLKLDLGLSGRKVVLCFTPDMQRLVCATDNRLLIWNLARLRQEARV